MTDQFITKASSGQTSHGSKVQSHHCSAFSRCEVQHDGWVTTLILMQSRGKMAMAAKCGVITVVLKALPSSAGGDEVTDQFISAHDQGKQLL